MAAQLSTSFAKGALSHFSAARIWGFAFEDEDSTIHITLPKDLHLRRNHTVIHRCIQPPDQITFVGEFCVTSVERTIIDLSAVTNPYHFSALLNKALRMKLTTVELIQTCLDRMRTRGRLRVATVRRALTSVDQMQTRMDSAFESRVLDDIRNAGLRDPIAQLPVQCGQSKYRIDFAYLKEKLAIEVDGPHHLCDHVHEYDRRRDAQLTALGWLVIHVSTVTKPDQYIPFLRNQLSLRSSA